MPKGLTWAAVAGLLPRLHPECDLLTDEIGDSGVELMTWRLSLIAFNSEDDRLL